MEHAAKKTICAIAALLPMALTAGGIYKCVGPDGQTVFSQTRCSANATLQSTDRISQPRTETRSPIEQLEAMRAIRGQSRKPSASTPQSAEDDGCPHIGAITRRNKIVGREVFLCMTRDEPRRVIGRGPDNSSIESDGDTWWHWHSASGNSFHARFDAQDRLRYWKGYW